MLQTVCRLARSSWNWIEEAFVPLRPPDFRLGSMKNGGRVIFVLISIYVIFW